MHWLNSRPVSRVHIVGHVVAVQEKELFGIVMSIHDLHCSKPQTVIEQRNKQHTRNFTWLSFPAYWFFVIDDMISHTFDNTTLFNWFCYLSKQSNTRSMIQAGSLTVRAHTCSVSSSTSSSHQILSRRALEGLQWFNDRPVVTTESRNGTFSESVSLATWQWVFGVVTTGKADTKLACSFNLVSPQQNISGTLNDCFRVQHVPCRSSPRGGGAPPRSARQLRFYHRVRGVTPCDWHMPRHSPWPSNGISLSPSSSPHTHTQHTHNTHTTHAHLALPPTHWHHHDLSVAGMLSQLKYSDKSRDARGCRWGHPHGCVCEQCGSSYISHGESSCVFLCMSSAPQPLTLTHLNQSPIQPSSPGK